MAILAHLQAAYPEALTTEQRAVHDLLGPVNERITGCATKLLASGDAAGLGTTPFVCPCFTRRNEACHAAILPSASA